MFIDTRQVESGTTVETAVCIIGGGVAGITIAREMEKAGIDTCILESGGFVPDNETRDLYRGEYSGLPYSFADGCRSRYLGGSSNCWGGWCRPLDAWDFDVRSWVPHSGWPVTLDELIPFYKRTHETLKLGPQSFDPAFWEASIGRKDVRRIPLVTGKVRDTISQFSLPARFGKLYRKELKQADNIRVFLYANVVDIVTDPAATTVSKVQVQTLSGRRMTVSAKLFVLATGGIENARLLLASNKTQKAGLGNGNDLVGRFFMDHPRLMSGSVHFRHAWSRNKLYDVKYHYYNSAVSAFGTHIASQLSLRPEVLKEEKLLDSRVWFSSVFPGEETPGSFALHRCKQALLKKEQAGWNLGKDLSTMMSSPIDTLGYGFTRVFHPRFLIKEVKFQAIVEPEPDPNSRVTLSVEKRDKLGMNRVNVNWKLSTLVQRTFDRTFALIADELRASGIADVKLDPEIEGGPWPESLVKEGTWHHMGTTRMHDSPKQGVVDRNCKVHGMSNLYVAGSSVFTTAGANFPTITLSALALRLSDHIVKALHSPNVLVFSSERGGDAVKNPPAGIPIPAGEERAVAAASFGLSGLLSKMKSS